MLNRYFGFSLMRYTFLILTPFILIGWLDHFSGIAAKTGNADGEPLNIGMKLIIALGWALPDALNFTVIAFMLASVVVLVIMGRRAELHVIRGAGLSSGMILMRLVMISAMAALILTVFVKPLAYQYKIWSHGQYDPSFQDQRVALYRDRTIWVSAENGTIQGRVTAYDSNTGQGQFGLLSYFNKDGLLNSFAYIQNVKIDGFSLTGQETRLDENKQNIVLKLDEDPQILPLKRPSRNLPLPHLLGLIEDADLWTLNARQRSFFIQYALAEPLLTASLVLVVGAFCTGIGTRRSIGRLIFTTIVIVVLAYSLFIITRAFGINGQLSPIYAAWGTPMLFFSLGGAVVTWQNFSWSIGKRHG